MLRSSITHAVNLARHAAQAGEPYVGARPVTLPALAGERAKPHASCAGTWRLIRLSMTRQAEPPDRPYARAWHVAWDNLTDDMATPGPPRMTA